MKRLTLLAFALVLLLTGIAISQDKDKKKTKKKKTPSYLTDRKVPKVIRQYKKQNRDRITDLVKKEEDAVIKYFEAFNEVHKNDLESYYGLALAYAQKGDIDKAMANVKLARSGNQLWQPHISRQEILLRSSTITNIKKRGQSAGKWHLNLSSINGNHLVGPSTKLMVIISQRFLKDLS